MTIATIEALLACVSQEQLQVLSPVRRMRLAQILRHVATMADPSKPADPREGALARLRDGERAENCE
jgi:hypothetical protein